MKKSLYFFFFYRMEKMTILVRREDCSISLKKDLWRGSPVLSACNGVVE